MIMKIYRLFSAAALLSAILFSSCEKLGVVEQVGGKPADNTPYISLMAEKSLDKIIKIEMVSGDGFCTENIFAKANYPLLDDRTVVLEAGDEDFVKAYSARTGIEYKLLPKPFYDFIGGGSMVIRSGAERSAKKEVRLYARNPIDNTLDPGHYLLPLKALSANGKVSESTVIIDLDVRGRYTDPDGVELYKGEDMFTVFYLNTSDFDPRLANDMILLVDENYQSGPKRGLGNIINLLTSKLNFDETTGKVSVKPSNDLRYLLDHASVRIRPVQESGRKVCICIEGGGRGIGFCNLTDEQIAQFTASVLRLVDDYGLDGVNLWDRKSGYGKEGCPPVNTTSYPKLIKSLREALGPFRLLTLTDYEEPTAYFDDIEASGGIAVGEYLDYAWSGYYDESEPIQVIDPWHQDLSQVSKLHPRKPIAGLSPKRYGCIHDTVRRHSDELELSANKTKEWSRLSCYNGIFVFYGIRSLIQDKYEGQWQDPSILLASLYDNNQLSMDFYRLIITHPAIQYNRWVKDW